MDRDGDLSVMRRLYPPDRPVSGPQQDRGARVVNREIYSCGLFIDCENPDFYLGAFEGHDSAGNIAFVIRGEHGARRFTRNVFCPFQILLSCVLD